MLFALDGNDRNEKMQWFCEYTFIQLYTWMMRMLSVVCALWWNAPMPINTHPVSFDSCSLKPNSCLIHKFSSSSVFFIANISLFLFFSLTHSLFLSMRCFFSFLYFFLSLFVYICVHFFPLPSVMIYELWMCFELNMRQEKGTRTQIASML